MIRRALLLICPASLAVFLSSCSGNSPQRPSVTQVDAQGSMPSATQNITSSARGESQGDAQADVATPCVFRDIAEVAGVTFSYYRGARGRMHVRETMGGGVGLIDFDADGWLDLFFTNGCDLPLAAGDRQHVGQLFRNQRDGTFVQATENACSGDSGYGQGCAVGDCNNDGFDDLAVTYDGGLSFYRNNGDGTLSDEAAQCGVASTLWNTACALGDLSGTGQLDLFVTGYLDVGAGGDPICRDRRGNPAYCGPELFPGQSFHLFRNQGDGSYRDVSEAAGVIVPRSKGLAAAILDMDGDGRLDVFVVNDAEPARLFHNDGDGRFRDVALTTGLAFNGNGQVVNGMGIAQGDYDGDGQIDLLVSNFYEKGVVLFRKLVTGGFRDESIPARIGPTTRPFTSFGIEFMEIDNDGWLDVFIANGHIADLRADGIPYGMKPQLFRNGGDGRFRDVSAVAGSYFNTEQLGRGVAVGDLDNDGGEDVVVSHNAGPVALLHNESPGRGHYVLLDLVGTQSSRTAFGAQVTATLGTRKLVRTLGGGGSYLSASDRRVLLGLGAHTSVSTLEILWPSGAREQWSDLPGDTVMRMIERR